MEGSVYGAYQVSLGLWFLFSPCLSEAHRGSPSCVPELADGPGRTPDARLISLGFLLLDLNCVILPFFVSPPLVFSRCPLPQCYVCLLVVCSGRLDVNNSICRLLLNCLSSFCLGEPGPLAFLSASVSTSVKWVLVKKLVIIQADIY